MTLVTPYMIDMYNRGPRPTPPQKSHSGATFRGQSGGTYSQLATLPKNPARNA